MALRIKEPKKFIGVNLATLYFYTYNNYYNRRFKKADNIEDYGVPIYSETNSLNFNPNDGVNSVYIAGRAGNPYTGKADYAIYCEDNFNITSRWFIIEQTRTLKNQYKCTLRRDVVVDYYDDIINAPSFIEKATLTDDDKLIYNDEGITVNEIKTEETLLKDETGIAWLIGYLDKSYNSEEEITFNMPIIPDMIIDNLTNWEFYKYISTPVRKIVDTPELLYYFSTPISQAYNNYKARLYQFRGKNYWDLSNTSAFHRHGDLLVNISADDYFNTLKTSFQTSIFFQNYQETLGSDVNLYNNIDFSKLGELDGQILQVGTSGTIKYYKVGIENIQLTAKDYNITQGTIREYLNNLPYKNGYYYTSEASTHIDYLSRKIILTEVTEGTFKTKIQKERYKLKDAPFDMFCIPYGECTIKNNSPAFEISITKSLSMAVAQGIAAQLNANLYDIQLLPYCPMSGFSIDGNIININASATNRYTFVTDNADNKRNILLWSTASTGSKTLNINKSIDNKKLENQCGKYRIISPNYNGEFEFNAAKNAGINGINIDFTYLPYQPYIHVNPVFNELYGQNFNDARGLICGGDFSITYLNDKWASYKLQNKNYQNIFDREVQNMETNRKHQRAQEITAATVGAISSGVSAGIVTGNLAAGIGAGIASGAGGVADIAINENLYNEALNYKKDLFGYQLDNIRALPNSIAKTTGYTANNKLFPQLVYYTCTEREKRAVANKVAYNGMSVGVIGKISDYIYNSWSYEDITDKGYIKAQIIRLENIADDTHLLNAIAEEIYKGVYFK
nr:MAG TPA: hypothetical protein [Caudoviricetes sp.]